MVVLYNWPIYFHYYIFFTETMIESKRRKKRKKKKQNGWFLFSGLSREGAWVSERKQLVSFASRKLWGLDICSLNDERDKSVLCLCFLALRLHPVKFETEKDASFYERDERSLSFVPTTSNRQHSEIVLLNSSGKQTFNHDQNTKLIPDSVANNHRKSALENRKIKQQRRREITM